MTTDVRDELVALLPRLRRFAFSQTRSMHDADDLVQAAYERALTSLDQFHPGSRLDNWMFTIVRNIWIDNMRAKARRPEVTSTDLTESIPYQDRITERAEARSDLLVLSKVMMELSSDQLSVLTLVVVNGCTYEEAAEILDVPKGTVMSRLSRARAKLAAGLDMPVPTTLFKTKDVGNDPAN
ncbi:MAG: RNA polymerase sigma factor [Hyphomicrobiaceae bacterium]